MTATQTTRPVDQTIWAPVSFPLPSDKPQILHFGNDPRHVLPEATFVPGLPEQVARLQFPTLPRGIYRLVDPETHTLVGEVVVDGSGAPELPLDSIGHVMPAGTQFHLIGEPLPVRRVTR